MLSVPAKIEFILSRTAKGRSLSVFDRRLVARVSKCQLSEQDRIDFEWLFEFVRQNNSAPHRWLFDLAGLTIDENGRVHFEGQWVEHFNLNRKPVDDFENFTRNVLYPACLLAKKYDYQKLSLARIAFFVNELNGTYNLHPITADTFFGQRTKYPPRIENQFGFLNGVPAITIDAGSIMYQPFIKLAGEFFFCERFLTVDQFSTVTLPTWIASLPNGMKAKISAALR